MWLKLDWGVAELAAVKKVPSGTSLRYRGFERKRRLNGGGGDTEENFVSLVKDGDKKSV